MENIAGFENEHQALFQTTDISSRTGVKLITGAVLHDRVNYWCRGRVRDDFLLLYTFDGAAWVREGTKKRELKPGSWFLLRPGIVHQYRDTEPWSFAYIHFAGELAAETLDRIDFFSRENLGFQQSRSRAAKLLAEIINLSGITAAEEIVRAAKLIELLAVLQCDYFEPGQGSDFLELVRDYIRDNLDRAITLDELAKLAGLSQFHFCRKFRTKTGFSPLRFVQKLRIEEAAKQLRQSAAGKVLETAEAVGFDDPLYFSKVFKKWTGMSPSDYKSFLLTAEKKDL
jgi:AraC-like DNA-binding protein